MTISPQRSPDPSDFGASACFGDCADCGRRHDLPAGNARALALDLMRELETTQRLDFRVPESEADPRYSLANVIRPGYGNMFGVLECQNAEGESVVLRAFSSLWEGIRDIDGWVLPLLDAVVHDEIILPGQAEIKEMTSQMNDLPSDSTEYRDLKAVRRETSQSLWAKMRAAYRFRNSRGAERSLDDAVLPGMSVVSGMGECCAPKLLNHAVLHGLRPISIAEFYWGIGPQKRGRVSGEFYASCEARCQPLLGYMLCGLDEA